MFPFLDLEHALYKDSSRSSNVEVVGSRRDGVAQTGVQVCNVQG